MIRATRVNVVHAMRVAAVATVVVAVVYTAAVGVFDVVITHRLVSQVDTRLTDRIHDAQRQALRPSPLAGSGAARTFAAGADVDDAPVFMWQVSSSGNVISQDEGAPNLPSRAWLPAGSPHSVRIGAKTFRLEALPSDGGWLVAGISLADVAHVQHLLLLAELVAGPVVLFGMFVGAVVVGVRSSAPVEQMRRRQLEFTADASHELRTPLSVIEAEVDLALGSVRAAGAYRDALERVRNESGRLARIVEDLLWLARFDSAPPPPVREPIDLATIAEVCVERFGTLAAARDVTLVLQAGSAELPWVNAPAEWMDRLAGVLLDNACRYTPTGGTARVSVAARSTRVALVVEDSGPGIDPSERSRLFDRFHRASEVPGGTGLGLAIADSIVRSTGGRWLIGDSELGGARMEVSWPRPHGRDRGAGGRAASEARQPSEPVRR